MTLASMDWVPLLRSVLRFRSRTRATVSLSICSSVQRYPDSLYDRPPVIGGLKNLLTILGNDVRFSNAAVSQKLANGLRSDDPLPRIESSMEIGAKLLYGRPPCGGARLEHARSPGGDSELPARPYHAPQFPDLVDHIRHEEDREHAYHRIE